MNPGAQPSPLRLRTRFAALSLAAARRNGCSSALLLSVEYLRRVSDVGPSGTPLACGPISGPDARERRDHAHGRDDKASNKIEDLGGKAKEGLGKVTGDKSTENEGKADQAKSSLKDAVENVKDAFKK